MKKIILAMLVASIGMCGYGQIVYHEKDSYKVGELYYAKLTDSTAEVLENQDIYSSYPRIIDVPSVVEIDGREYQVVRIGDRAFQLDCIGVESIRIPETIREIGQGAFAGITVPVKLPDSLRKIEWAAFGGAVIDTFIVPRGVEMMAEDVLSQAMVRVLKVAEGNRNYVVVDSVALCSADTSLLLSYQNSRPDTEYTVPASVRRIAGSAFYGNETLKRVVLPEGLEEIGTYAFGNGLECLEIPAGVRRIDGSPREAAPSDFVLTVAPGNTHYKVEQGSLLSMDGDTLLMMVGAEGNVTVPEGVKVIGEWVFAYNNRINVVTLPNGLEEIGGGAFELTSANVSIPSTVKKIANRAFYENEGTRMMTVPMLREIGDDAFRYSFMERVNGADSLRKVGANAFLVSKLSRIEFGDKLEEIGQSAFQGSHLVGTMEFRSHIKGIGMYAFSVGGLKRVIFRGGVDTIGRGSLSSRVVRFCTPEVPKSYGVAFKRCDTVYVPCGYGDVFEEALPHEENMQIEEWCDSVGVSMAGEELHVELYPNPSQGNVTVRVSGIGGMTVKVTDMAGRIAKMCSQATDGEMGLDLGNLASGVYFVTVTTERGTGTRKLVIER